MRLETRTVRVGEWLGDVPADWDFDGWYTEHLARSGYPRDWYDRAVALYKEMAEALKRDQIVYATQTGGYEHLVYSCGLYDGWVFWKSRPCYSYKGPIAGAHRDEFYNLRSLRVVKPDAKEAA